MNEVIDDVIDMCASSVLVNSSHSRRLPPETLISFASIIGGKV